MIQRTFHENNVNNEQVCGLVLMKIQEKRIKILPTQTFKMRLKSGTRLFRQRSIAFFMSPLVKVFRIISEFSISEADFL